MVAARVASVARADFVNGAAPVIESRHQVVVGADVLGRTEGNTSDTELLVSASRLDLCFRACNRV